MWSLQDYKWLDRSLDPTTITRIDYNTIIEFEFEPNSSSKVSSWGWESLPTYIHYLGHITSQSEILNTLLNTSRIYSQLQLRNQNEKHSS